jgi:hypothetical protein
MRSKMTVVLFLLLSISHSFSQNYKEYYPLICSMTEQNPEIQQKLFHYFDGWSAEGAIHGEESVRAVLDQREAMGELLSPFVKQWLRENYREDYEHIWELNLALQPIGLYPLIASDTLVKMFTYPHLMYLLPYHCSEEYALYHDYQHIAQFADYIIADASRGSYWFWTSGNFIDLIAAYQSMKDLYPESSYLGVMKSSFEQSVAALFDFHLVVTPDTTFAHVGGISADPSKGMVNWEDSYLALEYGYNLLDSVLAVAVNNPSVLNTGTDYHYSKVYLVSVAGYPAKEAADQARIRYLTGGKDMLHVVEVNAAGKRVWHNVYRFYTDKAKAEEALRRVKKIIPAAKIVVVDESGKAIK